MSAAVLQFPSARSRMKVMRDQLRQESGLDDEQGSQNALVEDELAIRRERFRQEAVELMSILAPVFWQWNGTALRLSFAAKPEAINRLSIDVDHALILFSAIHAVVGRHWWTIESADGIEFDDRANLVIVSFTVAEHISRKSDTDDIQDWQTPAPADDCFDYFQPGVNDADFDWRYVFKKN